MLSPNCTGAVRGNEENLKEWSKLSWILLCEMTAGTRRLIFTEFLFETGTQMLSYFILSHTEKVICATVEMRKLGPQSQWQSSVRSQQVSVISVPVALPRMWLLSWRNSTQVTSGSHQKSCGAVADSQQLSLGLTCI